MGDGGTITREEGALSLVFGDHNCVQRQVSSIVCAMEIRPELRKFLDARIGCFAPGLADPQMPNTIPESFALAIAPYPDFADDDILLYCVAC